MASAVFYPHIAHDPKQFDGWAYLAGTRVRVVDVASWYKAGLSADQIAEQFPRVAKGAVFAALAYYCDHLQEIEAQFALLDRDWRLARRRRKPPIKLARAKRRTAAR